MKKGDIGLMAKKVWKSHGYLTASTYVDLTPHLVSRLFFAIKLISPFFI